MWPQAPPRAGCSVADKPAFVGIGRRWPLGLDRSSVASLVSRRRARRARRASRDGKVGKGKGLVAQTATHSQPPSQALPPFLSGTWTVEGVNEVTVSPREPGGQSPKPAAL